LKHKIVSFAILFYFFVVFSNYYFAQSTSVKEYQFISPIPNSSLNQPGTTIIIRDGGLINESTLDNLEIIVEGSKSGNHGGDIILARDSRTLIYKPAIPFATGEGVYVKLLNEVKTKKGRELPPIKFSIPNNVFVLLKVYNLLGNEVRVLVEEELPAGRYPLELDATGLPTGIYFYRLQADEFTKVKKMILLK